MEEAIAMRIAIDDFNDGENGRHLVLHIKNSRGDPTRAAHAARDLTSKHHVRAIVGPGSAPEAAAVAEHGRKSNVPVVSMANEIPSWLTRKYHPFLVNAARSQRHQMEAIAAVLRSWRLRKVNVIYQYDAVSTSFKRLSNFPTLIAALQENGLEVNDLLALPPLPEFYSIREKLEKLRKRPCRVFIVHTSVNLAVDVFREAKGMGLMESDQQSIWITTDDVTNYLDSLDPGLIAWMQGVVGVRMYFPHDTKKLKNFKSKFHSTRGKRHIEPGIFALQAYDAAWALAFAIRSQELSDENKADPIDGRGLSNNMLNISFSGITGEFKFVNRTLESSHTFQLVNVFGRTYREIGYWTKGLGFSRSIGWNSTYSPSIRILGQIFWPGGPWEVPRGWVVPTIGNNLKIGVPLGNAHPEFVYARYESPGANLTVTGFSIDVFSATLAQLPYHLGCEFHAFNEPYDSLVKRVYTQDIHGVVADTAIVAKRYQYVEFTQPYSDSNLQIIIYVSPKRFGRAWLILKPFTTKMWIATALVNILCGLTVFVIERAHHKDVFRGGVLNQTLVVLTLSFTTLFALQGHKLHSNLSRMTMVVWLFTAVVIIQIYTASLSSFLTVEKLTKADVTVESLIRDRVKVGCDRNSFVVKHLEGLGFSPSDIKIYYEDEYAQALKTGVIRAAFLESPHARVFLAKNCRGFITAKQTVQVGGFGFVFEKNSPYIPDISEAVLKIAERGTIRDLENSMLSSCKCVPSDSSDGGQQKIGIESFLGLFGVTIATSIICLLVFVVRVARHKSSNVSEEEKKKGEFDIY